jgi:large subunit ribosomal protein L9
MKVILNKDLSPLGEEGDIKEVAKGYARNYLFPRGIALPHTERTVRLFEARRDEIEARKAAKRQDAAGLKERLEALEVIITMPAGANGRLYGAVTGQLISEELGKLGYPTERKRIDLPGNSFKSVGRYKVTVRLYESAAAEITVSVEAQPVKTETRSAPQTRRGRRREEEAALLASGAEPLPDTEPAAEAVAMEPAPAEAPAEAVATEPAPAEAPAEAVPEAAVQESPAETAPSPEDAEGPAPPDGTSGL